MSEPGFPAGWDAERVKRLIDHHESMAEDVVAKEDEAAVEEKKERTEIEVPVERASAVRQRLADHKSGDRERAATQQRCARWVIAAIIGVVVLLAAAIGGYTYYAATTYFDFTNRHNKVTQAGVEAMVQQAIPPNASRQQVEAWLKSQNIKYDSAKESDFIRPPNYFDGTGLVRSQVYWTVGAEFDDPYINPFDRGKLFLDFFFDKDGKLIKHQTHLWVLSF